MADVPRLRIRQIVIDSQNPERTAEFWSLATGREITSRDHVYTMLPDPEDDDPLLLIQRVDEPKTTKNRVHVDLYAVDPELEARRLIKLGAARIEKVESDDAWWLVMADPDGNEFCILQVDPEHV
jgi:hypothetical protein